ncbi:MAG: DUF3108 domain-containing protein [Gemmatimonadota bacterium]|nr:DUF3108 domain-containing protein [Gemmatimonadota bacterium]
MQRILTILGLTLSLAVTVPLRAQNGSSNPSLPEAPFAPGERMEYEVSYGVVPAGTMSLSIDDLVTYEGRPAYHILFDAETNRAASYVFQIDTHEESWLDAERFHSLRYRKRSIEEGERRVRDYRFDQRRHLRIEPDGETKPASENAVDQLSFIYFLRQLPLEPRMKIVLTNQADPDDNPVVVRVRKRERIKVPAGSFETLVLDMEVKTDSGVFKKGGENRIWVTDDDRKVPVRISSKMGLGSFRAQLVEYDRGTPIASR